MALLPNTGMESLPAGTTNVQGIIDANFAILDALVSSYHDIPTATNVTLDEKDGLVQSIVITANLTITAINNLDPGNRVLIAVHTSAARTVTVPGGWVPVGTPVLSTPGAGAMIIIVIPTTTATLYTTL